MKQSQKLDALIKRIIKEELDNSKKGMLDVTISEKFARLLMDPRVSDNPSYINNKFITSKNDGKNYNLKLQSKTPEFKELKQAMERVGDFVNTPELENIYNDVMSAIEKADIEGSVDLIKKGRKAGLEEELDEKRISFITPKGDETGLTPAQKDELKNTKPGDSVSYRKPGSTMQQENEGEMDEQPMRQTITGAEVAGQVAEILNSLSELSKSGKDDKHKKLAAKAMKQLESAKAALEALTGHETMLEEKQREEEEKEGQKHVNKFKKHLTKLVKDPVAVEKISSKLDAKKIADLKKKMNSKDLDEEKLARVMLKHSLKEGWVKKK